MKAIYKRELASYFQTMMGPFFMAVLIAATGIYFAIYNLMNGYPYFASALIGTLFILMITVPVLTMRSFAEERRSKSDQCILTAPVKLWEIVAGKYLAMVTVFALPVGVFCLCPVVIHCIGEGSYALDYAAILSYFCIGCAYIAVGMFISSLTENQIIAAVATFGILLVLHLWDTILGFIPSAPIVNLFCFFAIVLALSAAYYAITRNWKAALAVAMIGCWALAMLYIQKTNYFRGGVAYYLGGVSFYGSFNKMVSQRILDWGVIFSYLSVAFMGAFLTERTLEKRRWAA